MKITVKKMKVDIIKDYEKMPEEEIKTSEEALKDFGHKHIGTVRKTEWFGHHEVNLGIIIYEEGEEE